jgi:hypothetical protein
MELTFSTIPLVIFIIKSAIIIAVVLWIFVKYIRKMNDITKNQQEIMDMVSKKK